MDLPFFLLLIAACFVLSLKVMFKRPLNILLPLFFSVLFIVEAICYWYKINDRNNMHIYNCWFPVEVAMYTYWVASSLQQQRWKKVIGAAIIFYLLFVTGLYIKEQDISQFSSFAYQCGILLLLPVLLFKLYECMNESAEVYPLQNPVVWLIIGLLISYLGSFIQFSLQKFLYDYYKDILHILRIVNIGVTYALYSCIIVYFVLTWQKKNSYT